MDELKLLFLNPALRRPGVPQVIVRRGDKWLRTEGRALTVAQTGNESEPIARGRVLATRALALGELTDADLAAEHDPSCRTVEGVIEALKRAYGADQITEDTPVTVVTFVVDEMLRPVPDPVEPPEELPQAPSTEPEPEPEPTQDEDQAEEDAEESGDEKTPGEAS